MIMKTKYIILRETILVEDDYQPIYAEDFFATDDLGDVLFFDSADEAELYKKEFYFKGVINKINVHKL